MEERKDGEGEGREGGPLAVMVKIGTRAGRYTRGRLPLTLRLLRHHLGSGSGSPDSGPEPNCTTIHC